ncbi:TPA: hypothetical protein ACH3X1_004795 [Trebouxia sp. C0004]
MCLGCMWLCSSCGDRFWHLPVQLAHLAWMASGIAPSPGQRHGQACQHVRAASHRVQPLCYQQDKRSNVGQGKGAAELRNRRFIYNKACSQSRQRRYSQRRDLNSVQSFHISVHLCEGFYNTFIRRRSCLLARESHTQPVADRLLKPLAASLSTLPNQHKFAKALKLVHHIVAFCLASLLACLLLPLLLHLLVVLPCFPPSAAAVLLLGSSSPWFFFCCWLHCPCQDPEHPGRALMTHAHAVVQEAAQIITDFTAQDACKAH